MRRASPELLKEVLREAERLAVPTEEEQERLNTVMTSVLDAVRSVFSALDGFVDASVEGSAAKRTWVKSRPEVDVFVRFSPLVSREKLEEIVVRYGIQALESAGASWRLRYADHPYVEGVLSGVAVNVVGCYDVQKGGWISAVDRTPYHTRYVASRLDDRLRREIRLAKAFAIGTGVYGAEIKIGGFSGYLMELLVLRFGGFIDLLEDVSRWRAPKVIELTGELGEGKALTLFPRSSLVVTDPVDPMRNVASAVTLTKLSEFVLASKLFFTFPSIRFFSPPNPSATYANRDVLAILFDRPQGLPVDTLWGEALRFVRSVSSRLSREGFEVRRWAVEGVEDSVLALIELDSHELPANELRVGPPVWMESAFDFLEKHSSDVLTVAGPWVSGERLYVLKRREVRSAVELTKRWLRDQSVSIPKDLEAPLKRADVLRLDGESLMRFRSMGFERFLDNFLDGRPPYLRGP
ncbi:MAG: CCA tRNA nucleotidyltransferase [Thaumarchaeota archaeon]|nr:CCA tRNA nucleotidyltransferase [Candidatus Calditenuaceae archaeon]MDW8186557.1 CCA tRNA nucleotidyltransferase [Nitrososphaerota archaeon]